MKLNNSNIRKNNQNTKVLEGRNMNVQVNQRNICNEWVPSEGPDDPARGLGFRNVFRRFDVIYAAGQIRPCEFHQGLAAGPSEDETTQGTKLLTTTFTASLVLVISVEGSLAT